MLPELLYNAAELRNPSAVLVSNPFVHGCHLLLLVELALQSLPSQRAAVLLLLDQQLQLLRRGVNAGNCSTQAQRQSHIAAKYPQLFQHAKSK